MTGIKNSYNYNFLDNLFKQMFAGPLAAALTHTTRARFNIVFVIVVIWS